MTKRKYSKAPKGKITIGGNIPQQGQQHPNVIVLTQPKRFGIDIADFTSAVRAAEDVDFSRRYKLYDLYSDILMDTHLSWSSRSDAMQYSVPTSSSGETASPTRRSTSRLSHHGSHDSSPTL